MKRLFDADVAKGSVVNGIAFALTVKLAVLLLGAMGLATMWMAVFADVGVSILAILNSLTLLRKENACIKKRPSYSLF